MATRKPQDKTFSIANIRKCEEYNSKAHSSHRQIKTTTDTFSIENIRKCEEYVFTMQKRLDKAVASNDYETIRNIFTILVRRSRAVKILAVWRITYRNTGKNTAGVDKVSIPQSRDREVTDKVRLNLLSRINISKKPEPIRRVYIPKPNGKKRPLGIPTLHDRIIQEIIRIALDPIVEYHSHENSFGFRPKRSCQDAMSLLYVSLAKSDRKKFILEGDIKGCFDHINHKHISNTLLKWQVPNYAVRIIARMLKSDISEKGKLHKSEEGTPQGGVISPLLANVALTDFDNYVAKQHGTISYHGGKHLTSPMIRYADDFVILCRSKTKANAVKEDITNYLSTNIGLTLSDEKTHITHIKKGFDFLGFTFKKYPKLGVKTPKDISDYTMLITPEREKLIRLLSKCKEIMSSKKTITQDVLIKLLNPILRGWGNYYRHVNAKTIFYKIDYAIWWKTQRWSKRRHNNKSMKWIIDKYFTRIGRSGYFGKNNLLLFRVSSIPIQRYIKAIKGKRVYSQDDVKYWEERERKMLYRSLFTKRKTLARKQKGICPKCNTPFCSNDELHTHHVTPKASGGTDKQSNLILLHAECHRELHR